MKPTYRFRITARSSSSRPSSTMPFNCTDPSEHRSSPAHNPSSVVFPLPDGPTIAIVEPASTVKLICSSTVNTRPAARYVLLILLTFRIVSAAIFYYNCIFALHNIRLYVEIPSRYLPDHPYAVRL